MTAAKWQFQGNDGVVKELGTQVGPGWSTWTLNFTINHDRWGNELPEPAHVQIVSGTGPFVRILCGESIDQAAFDEAELEDSSG